MKLELLMALEMTSGLEVGAQQVEHKLAPIRDAGACIWKLSMICHHAGPSRYFFLVEQVLSEDTGTNLKVPLLQSPLSYHVIYRINMQEFIWT